jgi:predicted nucleic acid-binding Zn ribbon protein
MSKWKDEGAKWGPHTHCLVCGNAIPEGERTCSEECAKKLESETSGAKRQQKMTYLVIFGMVAFLAVVMILEQFLGH